jgi:hypothetical protein
MSGNLAFRDTELKKAAVNWATTGAIADAYEPGSGPTAHVGALPPVIAGMVFRLVGSGDAASILLTIVSASVVVATALVLNRLFARLGTPACARGAALAFVCVVPVFMELEARSLRVYETATPRCRSRRCFLPRFGSIRVGLFDYAICSASRLLRPFSWGYRQLRGSQASPYSEFSRCAGSTDGARSGLRSACVGACRLRSAWALRNQAVMGETVWTRGNFGLEFAVGTHDGAVSPDNARPIVRASPGCSTTNSHLPRKLARIRQLAARGTHRVKRGRMLSGCTSPTAPCTGAAALRAKHAIVGPNRELEPEVSSGPNRLAHDRLVAQSPCRAEATSTDTSTAKPLRAPSVEPAQRENSEYGDACEPRQLAIAPGEGPQERESNISRSRTGPTLIEPNRGKKQRRERQRGVADLVDAKRARFEFP